MNGIVDVAFLRGKDSPPNCEPLNEDLFSRILAKSDTKIMESLVTDTSHSNSYCGHFVIPTLQKSWQITRPTRGSSTNKYFASVHFSIYL